MKRKTNSQTLPENQKETMEHEGDSSGTNCSWSALNSPKELGRRLEQLEIRGRMETI